jgi:iron complex outermembrane receptor protein
MSRTLITTLLGQRLAKAFGLLGAFLLSLGLAPHAFTADADEVAIEEVIVTGSYLKRSIEDSPSPLALVSSADIEDLGAQSLADIIQTLP